MVGDDIMDDGYFNLICYIATSARGCVEEPKMYGPFRLIDTIDRLIEVMDKRNESNEFYNKLQGKIQNKKYSVMHDEEEFINFLDEVVEMLVEKKK